MTTSAKRPQTLEQRINAGVAKRQFWFDDYREVADPHVHCSWCDGSLLIDYLGLGYQEMSRRLTSFAAEHSKCEPQLATRAKDMRLTPIEREVI